MKTRKKRRSGIEVFGEFYLEIQRHPIPELEKVNAGLIEISREPVSAGGYQ